MKKLSVFNANSKKTLSGHLTILIKRNRTWLLCFLLYAPARLLGQSKVTSVDTIVPYKGPVKQQLKQIKEVKKTLVDSAGTQPKKNPLIDTTI